MNQQLLSVFLATYTMIFVGCGSLYIEKQGEITFVGVALAWGAVVTANIYTFGHISGAHINPAVTFAYALAGQFPWKQVPTYVFGEVAGSTIACFTLKWIFNGQNAEVMLTRPVGQNPASDLKVVVLEIIITFIYVMTNCSSRADPRAFKELGGVAVGGTVFFLALVAGKVTGASMNSARTLGPAIVAWNFHKIWIYFISSVTGAVSATMLYFFHLSPSKSIGDSKQKVASSYDIGTMNEGFTNDAEDITIISSKLGEKSAEIELSRTHECVHMSQINSLSPV